MPRNLLDNLCVWFRFYYQRIEGMEIKRLVTVVESFHCESGNKTVLELSD